MDGRVLELGFLVSYVFCEGRFKGIIGVWDMEKVIVVVLGLLL